MLALRAHKLDIFKQRFSCGVAFVQLLPIDVTVFFEVIHVQEPHICTIFVSSRLLYMCGGHFHSQETSRVLHDGCLCPNPPHCRPLLAFFLDQPGCQCSQSAPG